MGVFHHDLGAVLARNFLHDGQAQARAVGIGTQGAVEGLEDQFVLGLGNARTRVFHLQQQHMSKRVGQYACGDDAGFVIARRGVVDGVVHQVAHQFLEQRGVALHPHTGRAGLGTLNTQVYAGTAYIARYGEPLHPDELQYHRTLAMQKNRHGNGYQWSLDDGNGKRNFPINPILVANDPAAMKGALLCGEGVMIGADVMVRPFVEQGFVKRVLAGWTGGEYELNAVFPRGHARSPKVRAFVDFLLERLNLDIDYMSAHCPYAKCDGVGIEAVAANGESDAEVGKRILEVVTAGG